jgi:RNA polymerase sigma-70 factor, ECF subfamily
VDEAAWIAAGKAGDVQAFNRLVLAHQTAAYDLAYRMLKDSDSAADATQDAFLSAFTHLHQFRGGSFKAWLLRIVLNQVYDHLRSLQRHPSASLDGMAEDEDSPALQIADSQPLPEDVALSRELMSCIEVGLATLPPDQRATLILSDIQGMSYEEIAVATSASLGTVKSRLSRSRGALRTYLGKHRELLPPSQRLYFERTDGNAGKPPALAMDSEQTGS